MLKLFSLYNC